MTKNEALNPLSGLVGKTVASVAKLSRNIHLITFTDGDGLTIRGDYEKTDTDSVNEDAMQSAIDYEAARRCLK